ncbi:P-loop containing nucleoside triphosphate hydrolase [Sesbania bispinosa]|nr:P-loop containing nucleoside triphosphate hydrolase [Sesbania bispinosa]
MPYLIDVAAEVTGEDIVRSMSDGRRSFGEWSSASLHDAVGGQGDVFQRSGREIDEEEELKWEALGRLPTYDRLRKGILKQVLENGRVNYEEIDITKLGVQEKKYILESILKTAEEDNEKFLHRMRDRIDRVGIEIPKIEVRFEHLSVEGDAYIGTRALPALLNTTMNVVEGLLGYIKLLPFKKRVVKILKDVSGIVKPSRIRKNYTPPGTCWKNGQGSKELSRRELVADIKPDPEIDAFMKATAVEGQETSLVTDYILKILGLEICADILVGDEMRRGISGGQKKRSTTESFILSALINSNLCKLNGAGEMLVGPAKAFFMDEISTGLDSSTTFQIIRFMRQMVHIMDVTMIISLLQPAPETYDLFDDIILLSDGFKCPERKGVADFLQEVTSRKDQEQYWFRRDLPYQYISVPEFVAHFNNYCIGQQLHEEIQVPFDSNKTHPAALVKEKTEMKHGHLEDGGKYYGAPFFSLINVMFNGVAELAMTIDRLPVFFKQRDFLFYPSWASALPIWVLRIPLSLLESGIWIILTYYTIGFAPSASRFFRQLLAFFCVHQMALSLFRFIAAIGRTKVVANTLGIFTILVVMIWCYYASPMMYGQTAIAINEFLDKRWSAPNNDPRIPEPTVGKAFLKARGIFTKDYWYWISVGALIGFSLLFNICFVLALTYLNPFVSSKSIIVEEEDSRKSMTASSSGKELATANSEKNSASNAKWFEGIDLEVRNTTHSPITKAAEFSKSKKGMVLPFQPLSLAFENVNYYIDMPNEMKKQGIEENRLQLLKDISGAFRPGVLTALVGVSGAGKTTLMDVLAGRKTGGYIEGSINISGYPKNQSTFARISGYCEQNDIHSPNVTVYESLLFSAWLRLSKEVDKETRKMFIEEVIELVELHSVRNFIVGLPGIDGLSTEQRKRLTIAVELVANPSIIFMDEPTTGLDARAATVVMRTVRNTVDTGRTVVCTIHQPSIDIFEHFDELLLMKRGGQVIYGGPLGRNSEKLIGYFEAITGIPEIKDGYNPATWMLEITSPLVESQLDIDFAELYTKSDLYQKNQELIKELCTPVPGTKDLYFPSKYSQSFVTQCKACFWKQYCSYWRNPQYNAVRLFITIIIGIIFGLIYWNKGDKTQKEQDLLNLLGAMYLSVIFLGASNTSSVQPVVAIERTVLYRERAAGMYSELPYAIGQVAIEVIYVAIQSLAYSIILYWMIGLPSQVDNFLWFYYFIFMSFMYFTLYGMMTVALTPNHQIAAIVMSFFISFWNLFSGFLIPRTQIPIWWRWYYWASPVAWTIYGLVTSQVGDKNSPIEVPGFKPMTIKEYLEKRLGFQHDFLGVVALTHIAFSLLFLFVFAYGIRYRDSLLERNSLFTNLKLKPKGFAALLKERVRYLIDSDPDGRSKAVDVTGHDGVDVQGSQCGGGGFGSGGRYGGGGGYGGGSITKGRAMAEGEN